MSRSILKKSGPMRVPRDDVLVDTKDNVKESEEDQCQSGGGEAEASVPDTSGEDRKDESKKPFKNKNLKAKDSMRLSSSRLGSSPRSRFLQKRKESGSPRLLKIKEGERTFTYPESVRTDPINTSSDVQERMSGKDTSHGSLKMDAADVTPCKDSERNTSGEDAEHKKSKEDTVDRAAGEYPVHRTSGKDPTQKSSKEGTVDILSGKDHVEKTSGKDSIQKSSKEDIVHITPGKDYVDRKSGTVAEQKTSSEDDEYKTPFKDPVHTISGKDAEHKKAREDTAHRTSGKPATYKTSSEDTVDITPSEDSVHRTSCEVAAHKASRKDTVHRISGKDTEQKTSSVEDAEHKRSKEDTVESAYPVHKTSGKNAEHKTSRENSATIACTSDDSGHDHVPTDVEEKGKTVAHLHTTSVTKSPNRTQIEQQGIYVASASGGSATEVLVRDDVVAENQDTFSSGYLTSDSHDEADNTDRIISEPGKSSHVESEKYPKGAFKVEALPNKCPSPNDEIEDHVLPTDNPSREHIVELQDRPAGNDGSKGDGEENLSIVETKAKGIEGVQTVTMVDIHPHATFHTNADNVEDVLGDVPFLEETVGVPVVPVADQIPANTEQVQGHAALEPFQKDLEVEDLSDSSSAVSSLLDGADRGCRKENIISSSPVQDMDNSVPEDFVVERPQYSNRKADNTPTSDTGAQAKADEDTWSFSDDECFV